MFLAGFSCFFARALGVALFLDGVESASESEGGVFRFLPLLAGVLGPA